MLTITSPLRGTATLGSGRLCVDDDVNVIPFVPAVASSSAAVLVTESASADDVVPLTEVINVIVDVIAGVTSVPDGRSDAATAGTSAVVESATVSA